MVSVAWQESLGDDVVFRIGHCAEKLSSWADSTFGALKSRIKVSERKLRDAQCCPPDANTINNCKALSDELDDLYKLEESYWHM